MKVTGAGQRQHEIDSAKAASSDEPSDTTATEGAEAADNAVDSTHDGGQAKDIGRGNPRHHKGKRETVNRWLAFVLLPLVAALLAGGAGYLKWQDASIRDTALTRTASARAAATDGTIAILSYKPETVEQQLVGARGRLTGTFQDSYTSLTRNVVIPGAQQRHISAEVTVPAAATVEVGTDRAVVLVFVNQTVTIGQDPPTTTASSVRVTLAKSHDKWLISGFDPV